MCLACRDCAGSNPFAYDANGNVTTRNGSAVEWYSYNLPKRINSGTSNTSHFFYGPDRARWRWFSRGNRRKAIYSSSAMIEGEAMLPRAKGHALCACVLLLYATGAHASGDPIVIYWISGAALVQVALLAFVLAARAFGAARLPTVAAYVLNLIVLWNWVWQSRQSSTLLGIGLLVFPSLVVAVLYWMLSTVARRSA